MKKVILIRVAALLFVIFLLPSIVHASEPYDYISAVIKSFNISDIAGDRVKTSKNDELSIAMKNTMVFNSEIKKARACISPFLKSNNDQIRMSAEGYNDIYISVIENNERYISLVEALLNNPDELPTKRRSISKGFSQNLADNETIWRTLFTITSMSTYTLIDQNRTKDGKKVYLTINGQERNNLIAQLEGAFGDKVKKGLQAGQFPIEGSASILWQVLSGNWISSDKK